MALLSNYQAGDCPSLSVVVNNYNYENFLADALDSALEQLNSGDELIIVDDGSTDASLEVLRRYENRPGVQVIAQQNQGQMKAVRTGMSTAQGDVLLLLDSDDQYLTGYLERVRELYRDRPGVDFVFSRAEVNGGDIESLAAMRVMLDRMEFPRGFVGSTKWAALMSYEFVGTPTSGLSLRRELAEKILKLPDSIDQTENPRPFLHMLCQVSERDANRNGLTADGVIVRAASALDAGKYYDDRPGFFYRIHGANKFATLSLRARWYLRWCGKRQLVASICETYHIRPRATARELCEEIRGRKFGKHPRRKLRVRLEYCLAATRSRGRPWEKLVALATAMGIS